MSGFELPDLRERRRGDMTMRELHEAAIEYEAAKRRETEGTWPVVEPPEELEEVSPSDELLEVLLCPTCDMELRAEPCSPVHALLQDNPLQHRLLLPLFEKAVREIRMEELPTCPTCKIPIATDDCPHAVDRWGQIRVSKMAWEDINQRLDQRENELDALSELHANYVDSVDEERDRAEKHKVRWGAEWAWEKFERMCGDAEWDRQAPTQAFMRAFAKMLERDE